MDQHRRGASAIRVTNRDGAVRRLDLESLHDPTPTTLKACAGGSGKERSKRSFPPPPRGAPHTRSIAPPVSAATSSNACSARLKSWRRVATRYDRLAQNHLSGLALAAIIIA